MNITSVRIADITVPPGRFRKDMGDLDGLAASLRVKQLQPIGVTPGRKLVFGERRLRAAQRNGSSHIFAVVIDLENPLFGEHDENEQRKEFSPSEKVAIARAFEEQIGERRGRPKADEPDEVADGPRIPRGTKTRDEAAKKAGFNGTGEYRRAAAVVDGGVPELVEAMDRGDVSPSAAAEVAKLPPEEQRETVAAGPEKVKEKAAEARSARPSAPPPPPVETRPPPHQTKARKGKPAAAGVGGEASPFPRVERAFGPLVREIDHYARAIGQSNGQAHRTALDLADQLLAHLKRWNGRTERRPKAG